MTSLRSRTNLAKTLHHWHNTNRLSATITTHNQLQLHVQPTTHTNRKLLLAANAVCLYAAANFNCRLLLFGELRRLHLGLPLPGRDVATLACDELEAAFSELSRQSAGTSAPEESTAPDESPSALFCALRLRLRTDDEAARLCEQLETAFRHVNQQNEVALADLRRHVAATSGAGKFAANPGDFKLSYGPKDDFTKGLVALVGAPAANASELYAAILREHERDKPFQIWSNQFKILYVVTPAEECNYRLRPAQEGGPDGYTRVLGGHDDTKRDAGQDGMTPEAFMQNYLDKLIHLMAEVHSQNMASFDTQIAKATNQMRLTLEQEQSALAPELATEWQKIKEAHKAQAGRCVSPSQAAEYQVGYKALKALS